MWCISCPWAAERIRSAGASCAVPRSPLPPPISAGRAAGHALLGLVEVVQQLCSFPFYMVVLLAAPSPSRRVAKRMSCSNLPRLLGMGYLRNCGGNSSSPALPPPQGRREEGGGRTIRGGGGYLSEQDSCGMAVCDRGPGLQPTGQHRGRAAVNGWIDAPVSARDRRRAPAPALRRATRRCRCRRPTARCAALRTWTPRQR